MKKNNLSGAVVLYNPDIDVIKNIQSYIDGLDVLYAVDNSDKINSELISQLTRNKKIIYISNNGNKGIANALNVAARRALLDGYHFMLTMDQDSSATENMTEKMMTFIKNNADDSWGLLSPHHVDNRGVTSDTIKDVSEVDSVMTSGNIISLKAYQHVGGFLDKLFIDYVDIEYCLRLRKFRYKIMKMNNVNLIHRLGATTLHNMIFFKWYARNHPPVRRYYIARNRLYVIFSFLTVFPAKSFEIFKGEIKDILKTLLLEDKKLKKIFLSFHGYFDFARNKYGKLS